jgi:hypothetical protein
MLEIFFYNSTQETSCQYRMSRPGEKEARLNQISASQPGGTAPTEVALSRNLGLFTVTIRARVTVIMVKHRHSPLHSFLRRTIVRPATRRPIRPVQMPDVPAFVSPGSGAATASRPTDGLGQDQIGSPDS